MKTPEEREETKQMKNLQKEISVLKRENAQLRKKNIRLESELAVHNSKEYLYEESEVSEMLEPVTKKNKKKDKLCSNSFCDQCGSSSVVEIQAGPYLLLDCQSCGHRSKKPRVDFDAVGDESSYVMAGGGI